MKLKPFDELPDGWQKDTFQRRRDFEIQGFGRLGDPVALTVEVPISPGLIKADDRNTIERHGRENAERQALLNTLPLLFTLIAGSAPVASGSWAQATGRGVPSLGSSEYAWGFEDLGAMAYRPPVIVEPAEAQRLVREFSLLTRASQKRLEVPLRALNRSRRQFTASAGAIDLRTGLEALVVPDGGQEIAFKAALFGAWMLGDDPEDRRRAFDRLKEAYNRGFAGCPRWRDRRRQSQAAY